MGKPRVALWVNKPYENDGLFNDSKLNQDNRLAGFHMLKQDIERLFEGECHTQDIYQRKGVSPDIVIFLDIPQRPISLLLDNWAPRARRWVILQESEVVLPTNWISDRHSQFDKIFTWDDRYIDGKKYIKLNFSNAFPLEATIDTKKRNKLCTLIAGNKNSRHPLELYSKRVEAIRWFEKHHPTEFDLYGAGWDRYLFSGSRALRALNRVSLIGRLLASHYPSYKGPIPNKRDVMQNYRFAICYENARDIPGYITEKIFDCFFAKSVPIYWGPDNITEHVPLDCFIDKRRFSSYDELYFFISNMDEKVYSKYISNIDQFLNSPAAYKFSTECFSEVIVKEFVCEQ